MDKKKEENAVITYDNNGNAISGYIPNGDTSLNGMSYESLSGYMENNLEQKEWFKNQATLMRYTKAVEKEQLFAEIDVKIKNPRYRAAGYF
jgi:hypothetical protein